MKTSGILFFTLFICCFRVAAQDAPITLKIQDKAPEFRPLRWLKGAPIDKLSDDQVYVLDFSGVYCPACLSSIPILSRLTEKYAGKVTFIAIYIYENEEEDTVSTKYVDHVQKFVDKKSQDIKYSVSVDDPKRSMVKRWMIAAGQYGIPTQFIVDHGKIAWIGDDINLDPVLQQIVAGTFEPALVGVQAFEHALQNLVRKALAKEDFARVVQIYDSIIIEKPAADMFRTAKFMYLLKLNEDDAYGYGYEMTKVESKNVGPAIGKAVTIFLEAISSKQLKRPDWRLANAMCDRWLELAEDDFNIAEVYNQKARFEFYKHDFKEAIHCEEVLLNCLSKLNAEDPLISALQKSANEQIRFYKTKF